MAALPPDKETNLRRENARLQSENARLGNEAREALERQTATADILKVIASSPSDVQPVFDAIAASANRLIGGFSASVYRVIDDIVHLAAFTPTNPAADDFLISSFPVARTEVPTLALVVNGETAQIADTEAADLQTARIARVRGFRSVMFSPLMSHGAPIGFIAATRIEAGSFADHHVQLLQTFADQAVIAIENARLFNETREALERQTATADILKVIASSPSDAQPVFDAIATSSKQLLGGFSATVFRFVDGVVNLAAYTPVSPAADEVLKTSFPRPASSLPIFDLAKRGEVVQEPDSEANPDAAMRELSRARGFRSSLFSPLMSKGTPIGLIAVTRKEPGTFADHHVQLLQTFADQAVIAIENVRLFDEVQAKTRDLTEALTYQTGSGNILRVIASSPTDVGPVLKAIVESACELCEAYDAVVRLKEGDNLCFSAHHGSIPTTPMSLDKWPISQNAVIGRSVIDKVPIHVHDLLSAEGSEFPESQELARRQGHLTILCVPMLREGESIGAIVLRRTEVHPFSDKQIALLQTFADQAVIALGNVRLFEQVQERTRDLSEALQQQTATAEVLKVISRSAFDLKPVFNTIVQTASRLCEAEFALIYELRGDRYEIVAANNAAEAFVRYAADNPLPPGRGSLVGRTALERKTVHIPDCLADPEYSSKGYQAVGQYRTMLGVPLLREGVPIGIIGLQSTVVRPFTEKQIELVTMFADQAVIAIENVRLFDEVQAKTRDLTEALQQQTATADVLKVISRSAFDLQTVLNTLTESAARLCGADMATVTRERETGHFHHVTNYNFPPDWVEYSKNMPLKPSRASAVGRALMEKKAVQIADVVADPEYTFREQQKKAGFRTFLGVPLLREGQPIGVFSLCRKTVKPFTDKQIELVSTFADQAVIAIENVRLFDEVQARTRELSQSLDDLRTAQDRLVQTEKLASLGQLTAGIAHEIKNPLNFVNNFSALSAELTDELNDVLKSAALSDRIRQEVDELTGMLKDNLEKVVQHGKRADSIVKNMLLHSREGSGEHRPADINALLDESLNLAYHGARAEKSEFNITLQRNFDETAGTIEVFPQEITRVFLNLISNGFYAATKRKTENGGAGFDPVLSATTRDCGDTVEIRIRDNGTGIPAEVKEKMFNPFFTTKPAGEGTGLGLSMSHDIIVKQHGGTIDVETEPGEFTEFRIVLPRISNISNKNFKQN